MLGGEAEVEVEAGQPGIQRGGIRQRRQQAVEVEPVDRQAEAEGGRGAPPAPAWPPDPVAGDAGAVERGGEVGDGGLGAFQRQLEAAFGAAQPGRVGAGQGRPSAASVSRRVFAAKWTASSIRGPAVAPATSMPVSPGSRAETSDSDSRSPSRKKAPRSRRSGRPAKPVDSADRSMLTGTAWGSA